MVGQTEPLKVEVLPVDASDKSIKWSSSNQVVATVDKKGIVTANAAGTANVTAESVNGITDSCSVLVLFSDVSNPNDYFYQPVYWAVIPLSTAQYTGL